MNEKELRELDAWIAVNLFGFKRIEQKPHPTDNRAIGGAIYSPGGRNHDLGSSSVVPYYHFDPAAAMQVLEKCAEKLNDPNRFNQGIHITKNRGVWWVDESVAATLSLAICLFAEKLFSK